MTEHPGDTADTRFRAFWAGVLGFLGFGIVLLLTLKIFGSGDEVVLSGIDQQVIKVRMANLEEVSAAQAALISEADLEAAVARTETALAAKKPGKTELVVPNSPTFLKQMTAPPEPAAPEGDAPAGEGEDKPAQEEPAEEAKPADAPKEN